MVYAAGPSKQGSGKAINGHFCNGMYHIILSAAKLSFRLPMPMMMQLQRGIVYLCMLRMYIYIYVCMYVC